MLGKGYRLLVVIGSVVAAIAMAAMVYWQLLALPLGLRMSRGETPEQVVRRLGQPTKEWASPAEFDCFPNYPCDKRKAKGTVLLFFRFGIAYYAYFDEHGRLYVWEGNSS